MFLDEMETVVFTNMTSRSMHAINWAMRATKSKDWHRSQKECHGVHGVPIVVEY